MNEHALSGRIREYAELLRRKGAPIWNLKVVGGAFQRGSVPDRLFCIRGQFAAMEEKNPEDPKEATPGQLKELEAISKAGGKVIVCHDLHIAKAWIDNLLDSNNPIY